MTILHSYCASRRAAADDALHGLVRRGRRRGRRARRGGPGRGAAGLPIGLRPISPWVKPARAPGSSPARALELDRRPAEAAAELAAAPPSLPVTLVPAARARRAVGLSAAGRPAEAAAAFALAAAGADPADRPGWPSPRPGPGSRPASRRGRPRRRGRRGRSRRAARAGPRLAGARRSPRRRGAARRWPLERAGEPEGEEAAAGAPRCLARRPHRRRPHRPGAPPPRLDPDRGGPRRDRRPRRGWSVPRRLLAVLRAMALSPVRPPRRGRARSPPRWRASPARASPPRPGSCSPAPPRGRGASTRPSPATGRSPRERPVVPGLTAAQQADLPDDAAFLAAWLPYDAGRYAEVVRALRALRCASGRTRAGAPDARWFLAWSLLRVRGPTGGPDGARGTRGQGDGQPARGRALLDGAHRRPTPARRPLPTWPPSPRSPDGWYALLSAARLARALPPASRAPAPLPPSPLPDPPRDPARRRRPVPRRRPRRRRAARGVGRPAPAPLPRPRRPGAGRAPRRGGRLHRRRRGPLPDGPRPPPARDPRPALGLPRRPRRTSLRPAARRLRRGPRAGARGDAPRVGLPPRRPERRRRRRGSSSSGPPPPTGSAPSLGVPAERRPRRSRRRTSRSGVAYLGLLADRFAAPAPGPGRLQRRPRRGRRLVPRPRRPAARRVGGGDPLPGDARTTSAS